MVFFLTGDPVLAEKAAQSMPNGFVALEFIDPSIAQEIRFAGTHNFVGHKIRGYNAPHCILTEPAARALADIQAELRVKSLSLKVYDCYRPKAAVDQFVQWAHDPKDTSMKKEFYPHIEKSETFTKGYLASVSSHNRGSTVDLTLVALPITKQEKYKKELKDCTLPMGQRFGDNSLDMGTGFDCFDPLSATDSPKVGDAARQNRLLLKSLMEKHGFQNMSNEWWHFTFVKEPFPNQYFDFEIR